MKFDKECMIKVIGRDYRSNKDEALWVYNFMLIQATLGNEAYINMLKRYKLELIKKRIAE